MKFIVIDNEKDFLTLKHDWNNIDCFYHPSNLFSWLYSWYHCYKIDPIELQVILQYSNEENNKLITILPGMILNDEVSRRFLFLSNSCSDYLTCLIDENKQFHQMINYIMKLKGEKQIDKIEFFNIREDSLFLTKLISSLHINNLSYNEILQESTYFIETTGHYSDYLNKLSKNMRKKIKRYQKDMSMYDLKFEIIDYFDVNIINNIINIHKDNWHSRNLTSSFDDVRRIEFINMILRDYFKSDIARIFVLKDDENSIISYRLGFIMNDIYYDWNTSYNIQFQNLSIGNMLCSLIIKYCFENNIIEYDFMRGTEDYKKGFSTGLRNLIKVEL